MSEEDLDYAMACDQQAIYEFTDLVARKDGTISALREQVKVLREALEKTVEANPVISFSHKGAFEYVSAIEKARLILAQTKPKEGERC